MNESTTDFIVLAPVNRRRIDSKIGANDLAKGANRHNEWKNVPLFELVRRAFPELERTGGWR